MMETEKSRMRGTVKDDKKNIRKDKLKRKKKLEKQRREKIR